ncbi:MAG: hypothetical protein V9F04_03370 [Dermatophilaceae bacterium]
MSTAAGPMTPASPPAFVETREHRSWYWYDWANSAYVTTTATVLFAPYLTSVATAAACPDLADGARCAATLSVLGIPVVPRLTCGLHRHGVDDHLGHLPHLRRRRLPTGRATRRSSSVPSPGSEPSRRA